MFNLLCLKQSTRIFFHQNPLSFILNLRDKACMDMSRLHSSQITLSSMYIGTYHCLAKIKRLQLYLTYLTYLVASS